MAGAGDYEKMDLFYLGRELDPATGKTTKKPLLYKNKYLTTHAAIIGMTGSGKTGLGIDLLEEAALDKLPSLVIDPKGDMANLLLSFPDLAPEDFEPWIDENAAAQKGLSRAEFAAQTASTWEQGITAWDQDKARIARMRKNVDFVVYTPGSSSGRPVSVLDSMEAPAKEVLQENDVVSSMVNSAVSSILSLVGIKADPLQSREHILLSSLVLYYWRKQQDVALEKLIGAVVNPPFAKIGTLSTDVFFPQQQRMNLAMQLNNILASPAFSGWTMGKSLRIEDFLYDKAGKPQVSIFSIAHLGDDERMFFVTMLLGKLIGWMRQQEGSNGLRCLLYMDEIFGYFPPSANPPSKKPMLLLLKQARAYGLGVVLSTQNPVDLDYKGLANIGTWFIGRLQTRQDQDRVMSGIAGSSDMFSQADIREKLSDMRGRTFLMYSAHQDEPILFETRWAMSYLKGPVSLRELDKLIVEDDAAKPGPEKGSARHPEGEQFNPNPPLLSSAIEQCFMMAALPVEQIDYLPSLVGTASVRFFKQSQGIDEVKEVCFSLPVTGQTEEIDWQEAADDELEMELCTDGPVEGCRFSSLSPVFDGLKNLRGLEKEFDDFLYHSMKLPLMRVPSLKLHSKPGETDVQF
ncbi:MAG: ATP-binding protein, partial [Desulfobulbus sp.]